MTTEVSLIFSKHNYFKNEEKGIFLVSCSVPLIKFWPGRGSKDKGITRGGFLLPFQTPFNSFTLILNTGIFLAWKKSEELEPYEL